MTKPIIRASGVDRLLACFGSRPLTDKYWAAQPLDFSGDQDGDEMTWRGNWCHWEAARRLIAHHGAICLGKLQRPAIPSGFTPSFWDTSTVDWYVENVLALIPDGHVIVVEERMTLEFDRFILTGGIDIYSISAGGDRFTIGDLKTGINPVDSADNNWQLACYAVLLAEKYPLLKGGFARIFQKLSDEKVSEVEIVELADLRSYLERRINEAIDRWLELETGYKQCRLCPCIEFCPAIKLEIDDMKTTMTPESFDALVATPSLRDLGDLAQRGRAIAGPIKKILDRFKERVANEGAVVLSDGTTCTVVAGEGNRTITAPKVAFAFVAEEIGEDETWRTVDMSVQGIEDQLVAVKDMQRGSKDPEKPTAKRWIKQKLSHLIQRPVTKELIWK